MPWFKWKNPRRIKFYEYSLGKEYYQKELGCDTNAINCHIPSKRASKRGTIKFYFYRPQRPYYWRWRDHRIGHKWKSRTTTKPSTQRHRGNSIRSYSIFWPHHQYQQQSNQNRGHSKHYRTSTTIRKSGYNSIHQQKKLTWTSPRIANYTENYSTQTRHTRSAQIHKSEDSDQVLIYQPVRKITHMHLQKWKTWAYCTHNPTCFSTRNKKTQPRRCRSHNDPYTTQDRPTYMG